MSINALRQAPHTGSQLWGVLESKDFVSRVQDVASEGDALLN